MKYALLSDIHANVHALDACLAHAQKQGVDRYAILGDLVGYGAYPAQVVERCQALQNDGAIYTCRIQCRIYRFEIQIFFS